jgi:signal transduction histidine kinase
MKNSQKLWLAFLLPGAAFWIVDALYSYLSSYHNTFIEALLTRLTPRELIVRLLVLILSTGGAYLFHHAGRSAEKSKRAPVKKDGADQTWNGKSDHARQLTALYRVTAVASKTLNLETVLTASIDEVLTAMNCQIGMIYLVNENNGSLELASQRGFATSLYTHHHALETIYALMLQVFEKNSPQVVNNISPYSLPPLSQYGDQLMTFYGAPMHARSQVVGVLGFFEGQEQNMGTEDVALMALIANQIGIAAENARLHKKAEEIAITGERQRLARDLHDSVSQSLYSITLFAEASRQLALSGDLSTLENELSFLKEAALQALKEMRLLVFELRPSALENLGLIEAIQQRLDGVEKRLGIETHLLVDETINLHPHIQEPLYYISQEALNNVLKHAEATKVTISIIQLGENTIQLSIEDNGKGFILDPAQQGAGMGLTNMYARVEKIPGVLAIHTSEGNGTMVCIQVQLTPLIIDSSENTEEIHER